MNLDQINQIEMIIRDKLIRAGIQCVFVCDHEGKVLVTVNMEDKISKIIGYGIPTVADHLLAGIKSAADHMARLLGEKTNLSLLLNKENEETIWINELTDELLLGTVSGNEVSVGVLRMKVEETMERIRNILEIHKENLAGKTVEVLVDRVIELEGNTYAEGKTTKMQRIRLLLPDNHDVSTGDYVFGKIVESRGSVSIGLISMGGMTW
jgi:hypothetical protein